MDIVIIVGIVILIAAFGLIYYYRKTLKRSFKKIFAILAAMLGAGGVAIIALPPGNGPTPGAEIYQATINTMGESYFVWMGAPTSAWTVSQAIDASFGAGEYIATWSATSWSDEDALWSLYYPVWPTLGNNWTIQTFDVVKTYLTSDIGDRYVNMTADTSRNYSNPRVVEVFNTTTNKGYNYIGYGPENSTLLTIAESDLGLPAGYWVGRWDAINDEWNFWISQESINDLNKPVTEWTVLEIKTDAHRWLAMPPGYIAYVDDDAAPSWYDYNHFPNITAAKNYIGENGTIIIFNGSYDESNTFTESLIIVGNSSAGVTVTAPNPTDIIFNLSDSWFNIRNIRFSGCSNGMGIRFYNTGYSNISSCKFDDLKRGVSGCGNDVEIYNCNFSANDVTDAAGVYICGNGWQVIYNSFWANYNAIYADGGTNATLRLNTIRSSTNWGLYADVDSKYNLVYNNYFNNTKNVYSNGANNTWNVSKTYGNNIIGGPYLAGNYWSNFIGNDTDGDGIADLPGWKRRTITINHSQVVATLYNFTILVNITLNAQNVLQADGGDILFRTTTGARLKHEIENYNDTTGKLYAWVKIPVLSSTTDTTIYMYYGNSTIANQWNNISAWDNYYRAVYHMDDLTTSTIHDSKGTYTGTKTGAGQPAESSTAKVYKDQYFDNSNDRVNIGDISQSYITLEAYAYLAKSGPSYNEPIINKGFTSHVAPYYEYFLFEASSTGRLGFSTSISNTSYTITGTTTTVANAWHHVVGTYNGNDEYLYIDGKSEPYSGSMPAGTISDYATNAMIGGYTNIATTGDNAYFGPGYIDEVRISSIARSAAWINTTYKSMTSATFVTYSDEISWPNGGGSFSDFTNETWLYMRNITINKAKIPSTLAEFPILVNITLNTSHVQADGGDIHFESDARVTLKHEIESYNSTTGALRCWVRVPSISSTVNTTIYMFYGNTSITNQWNISGTWNNDYIHVWHLGESLTDVKGSNNITNNGADTISGPAGKSLQLIKTNSDWLDLGDMTQPGDGSLSTATFEQWFRMPNILTSTSILTKANSTVEPDDYSYQYYTEASGKLAITVYKKSEWPPEYTKQLTNSVVFANNTWAYISFNVQLGGGTDIDIYVNGAERASTKTTYTADATVFLDQPQKEKVGVSWGESPPYYSYYTEDIDELRISKVKRSAAWINATYNTMYSPSTFATYSTEWTLPSASAGENASMWQYNNSGNITIEGDYLPLLFCVNTKIDPFSQYMYGLGSHVHLNITSYCITPSNVSIYYGYSTTNSSWAYYTYGTKDTSAPWSINFTFPSLGYYRFWAFGQAVGYTTEYVDINYPEEIAWNVNINFTYVSPFMPLSWYDAIHVRTTQEGVNNLTVSTGGKVYVWAGWHISTNVTVNKSCSIIGNGSNNTLYNCHRKWAFTVTANNVVIKNLEIFDSDRGIRCYGKSGLNLTRVYITGCTVGINLTYANSSSIYRCSIWDCNDGVRITRSNTVTMLICRITNETDCSHGIYMDNCSTVSIKYLVEENYENVAEGIHFSKCNSVNVSHSVFQNNDLTSYMIYGNSLSNTNFYNVTMDYCDNYAEGIKVLGHHIFIKSSVFKRCAVGLHIQSNDTHINSSTIRYCTDGIVLDGSASKILIRSNYIEDNTDDGLDATDQTNINIFNNYFDDNAGSNAISSGNTGMLWNVTKVAGTNIIGGAYLGGNYWDNYTGVDTNNDGLGNTNVPFKDNGAITGTRGDYLPLTTALTFVPVISNPNPPDGATITRYIDQWMCDIVCPTYFNWTIKIRNIGWYNASGNMATNGTKICNITYGMMNITTAKVYVNATSIYGGTATAVYYFHADIPSTKYRVRVYTNSTAWTSYQMRFFVYNNSTVGTTIEDDGRILRLSSNGMTNANFSNVKIETTAGVAVPFYMDQKVNNQWASFWAYIPDAHTGHSYNIWFDTTYSGAGLSNFANTFPSTATWYKNFSHYTEVDPCDPLLGCSGGVEYTNNTHYVDDIDISVYGYYALIDYNSSGNATSVEVTSPLWWVSNTWYSFVKCNTITVSEWEDYPENNITYQLLYKNNSIWVPIPNSIVPGNSGGLNLDYNTPYNISSVVERYNGLDAATNEYLPLRILASFHDSNIPTGPWWCSYNVNGYTRKNAQLDWPKWNITGWYVKPWHKAFNLEYEPECSAYFPPGSDQFANVRPAQLGWVPSKGHIWASGWNGAGGSTGYVSVAYFTNTTATTLYNRSGCKMGIYSFAISSDSSTQSHCYVGDSSSMYHYFYNGSAIITRQTLSVHVDGICGIEVGGSHRLYVSDGNSYIKKYNINSTTGNATIATSISSPGTGPLFVSNIHCFYDTNTSAVWIIYTTGNYVYLYMDNGSAIAGKGYAYTPYVCFSHTYQPRNLTDRFFATDGSGAHLIMFSINTSKYPYISYDYNSYRYPIWPFTSFRGTTMDMYRKHAWIATNNMFTGWSYTSNQFSIAYDDSWLPYHYEGTVGYSCIEVPELYPETNLTGIIVGDSPNYPYKAGVHLYKVTYEESYIDDWYWDYSNWT